MQAADEFCLVLQGVGHADIGIDQPVGVEDGAAERSTAEGDGSPPHEAVFAGRAFGCDAASLFHHAAACTCLAETHARPKRQALAESQLVVTQNGGFHDAQVLGIEMESDEVEASLVLLAQQGLYRVADLVGEEHLACVFLQSETCTNLVPIVIGVFELKLLWTAEIARVGLGQERRVIDGGVSLLSLKDLFVSTHELMLAITSHLVERDFVLALVFLDAYHGSDDGHGLLVEAFHHFQFIEKHEITVESAVFLQFFVLERADQMQLHQAHHLVTVDVDGVVAQEDVAFKKVFVVDFFFVVLCQTLHLLDEQGVQGLGAERVDSDLCLRPKDNEQGYYGENQSFHITYRC